MDSGNRVKRRLARKLWGEWLQPLLVAAVIVLPFRSAIADWNEVPSGSMRPTIVEGDRIFVNKLAYDLKLPFTTMELAKWADPQRGDIVVFFAPDNGMRLVKRVVGLPGDRLVMRAEQLYINGLPVTYNSVPVPLASMKADPHALVATETMGTHAHAVMYLPEVLAMRNFGPVTVPSGYYFMMGDNRDNSRDSRYFGFVARARIVGRVTTVVASLDAQNHYKPRWQRFFAPLP